MAQSAAALIIGNEILSGKTQEKNLSFLGRELFALGITLKRAIVCPDEIEVIVADLNDLRKNHDWVFTSGGVGPTHDDLTMTAIARAFGCKLVRSTEIEQLLREYYKSRITESHLRMADIPEGARLLSDQEMRLPTVAIENVFIFPGIPELFRLKFPALRNHLHQATSFKTSAIFLRADEGEIAPLMSEIALQHPQVAIGSYPEWNNPDYRVKVTVDGQEVVAVSKAIQALLNALPADKVVRVEE
jgi:molybdopterin-biosynthesis enzyme MoeA-like protein